MPQITVRLDDETAGRLAAIAEREGVSRSVVLRRALTAYDNTPGRSHDDAGQETAGVLREKDERIKHLESQIAWYQRLIEHQVQLIQQANALAARALPEPRGWQWPWQR